VNRSWTLPPAVGNSLEVTLPFLMKYREHRSIGGFMIDYFKAHQDVSHGKFSTGDIRFEFVCDTAPVRGRDSAECLEDDCGRQACLKVNCSVWLAPFDFGIKQRVDLAFSPAADERGFLEIRVQLTRLSGEANAWHRINKVFLHHLRRQLLIWRSFDDGVKDHYEQLLAEASETTDINALQADAT
jgi:hypothetical protein